MVFTKHRIYNEIDYLIDEEIQNENLYDRRYGAAGQPGRKSIN